MANAIYPKFKEAVLKGAANVDLTTGTIKVALVDLADYTYNAAHDFLDDVPVGARVAVGTITNPTVLNNIFDGDDVVLSLVTGDPSEALVIYKDTGVEATSRLVAFLDTGVTGLPVTPNGGNITIAWDNGANKIFAL
ncbi:hypothetical protein FHP25_31315 [Vineibacter terrae]|uniref:Uncharacterized protein n=1 Tax=Vineibacter terrae TaxID=2586908 RepID=A0A5C8PBM2_9HYPH|nr:hypothetical protein [Vineibacter terrae]TXL71200.1 hypothetical protein FHP25_31315 [Vineibacter terrae]